LSVDLEIELAGERLLLLPERAIYWVRRETLLIADTHWGKAATMRAAAIPIPGGTTGESLGRLKRVVERTDAKRIVLLGDCLHARNGRSTETLAELADWRARYQDLDIELVRGNHDRHAGDPPRELDMNCVDAPQTDAPFVYRHFPRPSDDGYTLAGHLHPAIRLYGNGAERATLPCFWFGPQVGVLPAFGGLTGMAKIQPDAGDRVCAIAGDEIVEIQY
jgi:DNA ligase-associated metallophosphoesterase